MKIGYVRTSGPGAVPSSQVNRLVAGGCTAVFIESSGGEHLDRPVLHRMINGLRPGDEVLVVDLERLSRHEQQMQILLNRVRDQGAQVHILDAETLQPEGGARPPEQRRTPTD